MEKDGLAIARGMQILISDEKLKMQAESSILTTEGRIKGIQQFINENKITNIEGFIKMLGIFANIAKGNTDINDEVIVGNMISSASGMANAYLNATITCTTPELRAMYGQVLIKLSRDSRHSQL